jgi:two-component system phosphate regulon sensor histidine kinase PhoR
LHLDFTLKDERKVNDPVWILVLALAGVVTAQWLRLRTRERDHRRAQAALRKRLTAEIAELERDRRRVEEILERMDEGVLLLDEALAPRMANRSARRLLGLSQDALPPRLGTDALPSLARRAMVENRITEGVVSPWTSRLNLRVRAIPAPHEDGVIVVVKDVTDELRTQQIRRQFVANASHELKSPVASLQALAEAIREAVYEDPRMAEHFGEKLVAEADRLGRLIADLLDLSRLEDPSVISSRSVDLSEIARRQVRSLEPAARAKRTELVADIASDVFVKGDDQQLGLMIRNLLDNAVRYTPEEGIVSVDVRRQDDTAMVRVSDNGIGIPLQAQARVFERFYRVDKDRSRERGGTGLGLSIVKHVVELHGGHISLDSELGEGTTFIVRLPAIASGQRQMRSLAS